MKTRHSGRATDRVEEDARGQFARSRHGRQNSGVSSAEPRVITGDEDATFETEPGEEKGLGQKPDG